jgi:hypothetical protein
VYWGEFCPKVEGSFSAASTRPTTEAEAKKTTEIKSKNIEFMNRFILLILLRIVYINRNAIRWRSVSLLSGKRLSFKKRAKE